MSPDLIRAARPAGPSPRAERGHPMPAPTPTGIDPSGIDPAAARRRERTDTAGWRWRRRARWVALAVLLVAALAGGAGTAPAADDGATTLLFMGVDARPGEAIDGDVRPDALMVVHLDPTAGSCRVLAVPRDTRAVVEGLGPTKVNHALSVGGVEAQVRTVGNLLGLSIEHHVLLDFAGFEGLVDAVGGIEIDVPAALATGDGAAFAAGPQEMDGARALSYARDRSGPDGDFGRIARQQQIIRALVAKASGLDLVTAVDDLLPVVERHIRTDLAATQVVEIGATYRSVCTEETIELLSLEGTVATFDDPLLGLPLSYVVVDEAEIRRKVAALLGT